MLFFTVYLHKHERASLLRRDSFFFRFTSQKAAGHGVRERMRVWGGECARVSECWEWVTVNVFRERNALVFDCASRKMSVATHRFVFKGKSFANFLKFFLLRSESRFKFTLDCTKRGSWSFQINHIGSLLSLQSFFFVLIFAKKIFFSLATFNYFLIFLYFFYVVFYDILVFFSSSGWKLSSIPIGATQFRDLKKLFSSTSAVCVCVWFSDCLFSCVCVCVCSFSALFCFILEFNIIVF